VTLIGNAGEALYDVYKTRGWCLFECFVSMMSPLDSRTYQHNKDSQTLAEVKLVDEATALTMNPYLGTFIDPKDKERIAPSMLALCLSVLKSNASFQQKSLARKIMVSPELEHLQTAEMSDFLKEIYNQPENNELEQFSIEEITQDPLCHQQDITWALYARYRRDPFWQHVLVSTFGPVDCLKEEVVTSINWEFKSLAGPIPLRLGSLSSLQYLGLSDNQLSADIPASLGSLTALITLRLHNNRLSGPIPPELGSLSSLTELYLSDNKLAGRIPPELGSLISLRYLSLRNNQLSGHIPAELGSLFALQRLSLSNNKLTGPIPSELGSLTSLQHLYLHSNRLTGLIPEELGALPSLSHLNVQNNLLTGVIPPGLFQKKDKGMSFRYSFNSCTGDMWIRTIR